MTEPFQDLLTANEAYAENFRLGGFDGVAHAGVAILTCMDSRIEPLAMLGLEPGDAKVLRNAGGRVTEREIVALLVAIHLLRVERVLVVPHTRCTMASHTEDELRDRVSRSAGEVVSDREFGVVADQDAALRDDVTRLRNHPLVPDTVSVGGFLYDVDTGLLSQIV